MDHSDNGKIFIQNQHFKNCGGGKVSELSAPRPSLCTSCQQNSEYATKWQPDPEKGGDWQQNSLHIAENNAETSRMEAETASYTASDASNWTRIYVVDLLFFLFCMLHRRCPPPHHSSCSMVLVVVILDQGVCMHPFPITSPPSQPMSTWYSVFIRSEIAPFVLPDTSAYSDPDSYFAPNASSVPRAFVPWIQPMDSEEELLPSWIPMGPEDECVPMLPMGPPGQEVPLLLPKLFTRNPLLSYSPPPPKYTPWGLMWLRNLALKKLEYKMMALRWQ